MKPKLKAETYEQPLIATMRLELATDMDRELVHLARAINWGTISAEFRSMYCPDNGRPAVPTRLMAGLQLLKHTFNLLDEQVVTRWENRYWQCFCGEEFFRYKLAIHPAQMTRWRRRFCEKCVEKLLRIAIEAGKATKTITETTFEKDSVDTTMQPKVVQYQTAARLYCKVHATMLLKLRGMIWILRHYLET